MNYSTRIKVLRTFPFILLLFVTFFSIDTSAQSLKPSYWQIGINTGGNLFFERDGYKLLSSKFTLNMLNFEMGYKFNSYHEAGISVGRNDGTYREFIGQSINGTDTVNIFNKILQTLTYNWYGVYYKFHLKNYLYAGIKLAHSPEIGTYQEFSLGKDFEIAKDINLRLNFADCIRSEELFKFDGSFEVEHSIGLTLGLNYHF